MSHGPSDELRKLTGRPEPESKLEKMLGLKPCGDGCQGCAFCQRESNTPPERASEATYVNCFNCVEENGCPGESCARTDAAKIDSGRCEEVASARRPSYPEVAGSIPATVPLSDDEVDKIARRHGTSLNTHDARLIYSRMRWREFARDVLVAASAIYDADTPPVGLFALRDAVRCLRETGRFVDEEGEATNALEDLLERLDSDGVRGGANG